MDNFHHYMISQLREYILNEVKRGSSWEDIEKALHNAGHDKNVIDEAFSEIKKEKAGLPAEEPKGDVEQDLVANTKQAISSFFGKLRSSEEIEEVKKEASPDVEETIISEAVSEAKEEESTYIFEGAIFFIYLLALSFLMLLTAGGADVDFILIVLGLSPTFLNAVVSFALIKYAKYAPVYVLIPIGLSTAFYALARFGGISMLHDMDYESLSIVNAVLGMLFNVILINVVFLKPAPRKRRAKHRVASAHMQREQAHSAPRHASKVSVQLQEETEKTARLKKHIDELKKEFNIQV